MSTSRRRLLAIIPLPDAVVARLAETYDLIYRPQGWPTVDYGEIAAVGAVVTNGTSGLSAERMAALPELGLIAVFGAGYENVDVPAARARNIAVTHAPGANNSTVADHALALALALARDIPRRDLAMRSGEWANIRAARPTLTGATVGLLGLGHIGRKIAQRAQAFETRVAYHTPTPKPDCPWDYADSPHSLANQAHFLFVACPGGRATHHLADAALLRALGSKGFLINIARGNVVDTAALIEALTAGVIAGAALDVYEHEPDVAAELLALPNVVCTPHMAGRSPQAETTQADLLMGNLAAFCAGTPLLTPVA
jgi:lactate dehydrogenase-like 2-hydroxyacid dehydrogenase